MRQGDTLSLYLFCLAIEIFFSILEKEVHSGNITLIPKCRDIKLSHLIFVDDLMIFSKVDILSLETINRVLDIFSNISGLYINREKSTLILVDTSEEIEQQLLATTGFVKGNLPMKYLRIPLVGPNYRTKIVGKLWRS